MEALTKREKFMKHCCLGNGTEEQNEYYRAHCMSAEEVLIGKPVFEMDKREFLEFCVLCENLKKGDKVRVIKGDFAGIEGELIRVKGHKRVVVRLEGVVSLATAYIPGSFLEKIE